MPHRLRRLLEPITLSPEEAAAVRIEQAVEFVRQLPLVMFGNVAVAAIAAAIFWSYSVHAEVLVWLGAIVLVTAPGIRFWYRFHNAPPPKQVSTRWVMRAGLYSVVTALPWVVAISLWLTPEQPSLQIFLVMVLCGLTAGTMISCAMLPGVALGFTIPISTALAIQMGIAGTAINLSVALMIAVYLLYLGFFVQLGYRKFTSGVLARRQAMGLMGELKQTQTSLLATIERMPEAVALFDADERLVHDNERFRKGVFGDARARTGIRLEDLLQAIAASGAVPVEPAAVAQWVEGMLAWSDAGREPREAHLSDGRDMRITCHRLEGGGKLFVLTDITELNARGAAVRESQQRLRDFAEASSDWLWEQDADLRFTFLSAGAQGSDAAVKANVLGRRWHEIGNEAVSEDGAKRLVEDMQARRPFRDFRMRRRRAGGEWLYLSISGRPVFDAEGEFTGYRGSSSDITETVKAAADLDRKSRVLQATFDNITHGVLVYDRDLKLVDFNPRVLQIFALPADQIRIGMSAAEVYTAFLVDSPRPPEERQKRLQERLDLYARGEPFALERVTPKGVIYELRANPSADGGWVTTLTDITARKTQEAELERSSRVLEATFENITHGVLVYDRDLKLVDFNPRVLELMHLPAQELKIGMSFAELFFAFARHAQMPADAMQRELKLRLDLIAAGNPFVVERSTSDGTVYEVRANPMPDGGWVFTQTDITERKRTFAELRSAKEHAELANRAKSEFLANMSHELRTPLNAVLGFAELMSGKVFGPLGHAKYYEYAQHIHDSGAHLLGVINDILDLSKIEAGKRELNEEVFDAGGVLRSAVRIVDERAANACLRLTTEVPAGLPELRADQRAVKQILLNLLSNAVKFTPEGGSVSATVALDATGGIRFVVTDTGIGMAPDDIAKALEPFGQVDSALNRKYEGTGLGLPLARSLVELHGGKLVIESTPGRGTTASVNFPPLRTVVAEARAAG